MGDHDVRGWRDAVGENGRALRRAHACHVVQILDRHGKARKQAAFGHRFLHQLAGMGAGPVKTQGRQGIDLAVDRGNALFQRIEAVQRVKFPRFSSVRGFHMAVDL